MELTQPFDYYDQCGKRWHVPAKATVDGASIPWIVWSIVGSPFTGRYRDASVIHDWYCAVRTEPWKAVHRMFYEAMLASGVERRIAGRFYFAVRYAGPSWDDLTVANNRLVTNSGETRLTAIGTGFIERDIAFAAPAVAPPPTSSSASETAGYVHPSLGMYPNWAQARALQELAANYQANVATRRELELLTRGVDARSAVIRREVGRAEMFIDRESPSVEAIDARADAARAELQVQAPALAPAQIVEIRSKLYALSQQATAATSAAKASTSRVPDPMRADPQ